MKTININGHLRTEFGKKATNQLRSQDFVPGVIYGGQKEFNFYANVKEFKSLIYTSEFQLVEINIGNEKFSCILKDLQFNKVTDALIHVDFLELVETKKIKADLPLKYTGTAVGVKAGGKLVIKMKSIKVKTLPKHLKEFVEVNITNLDLNQNIRIEDIKEPNFEILNSSRIPIASVVLTRQLKQEEATTATTTTAAPAAATTDAKKAEPKKAETKKAEPKKAETKK